MNHSYHVPLPKRKTIVTIGQLVFAFGEQEEFLGVWLISNLRIKPLPRFTDKDRAALNEKYCN